MTLSVLIVDDEPLARERLRDLLAQCVDPAAPVVAEAGTALQALQRLDRQRFDALLLDVRMPGVDGLRLAQSLRSMPHAPCVVFVTAHAEHALQAFELEALDYLTKPVRLQRLQAALQKVRRVRLAHQEAAALTSTETMLVQHRGGTERVPLEHILYLKAELKYTTVRTPQRSFIVDDSLTGLETRYARWFIRVHRNALVARAAIRALHRHADPEEGDGWAVHLHGSDEWLLVSRRQLAAVREAIAF